MGRRLLLCTNQSSTDESIYINYYQIEFKSFLSYFVK
jgi:hypothetical protein